MQKLDGTLQTLQKNLGLGFRVFFFLFGILSMWKKGSQSL
jgi:hypothetical protein